MSERTFIGITIVCVACALCACTPSVRKAEEVVIQADSLWHEGKQYGMDEGDSATLAQAYETLNNIPSSLSPQLSTTFAHACYHYGRLLREKDDPVTAMQVFINATHSRTSDYHILGRVYSNMGSICHLAGEFPLSYDMYEQSADYFWKNGDTLLYYFGLYRMAYELASDGLKDSCFYFVQVIENSGIENYELQTYCNITRAEAFLRSAQYDSTIYYARLTQKCRPNLPSSLLQLAQAYSLMGLKDSSVYYAQYVLSVSNELFDQNSALYILTHNDDSKNREDVRKISADRSDVQKLIEIHQGKLSQAVQLLEQDLNRKPDLRWLYAIIVTLLAVGICIVIFIAGKRKKQMISLVDKHAYGVIESIKQHIDTTDINNTLHWKSYADLKLDADLYMGGIVSKLESCNLNEVEIRFCILTMLDFRLKQIAETIHYGYPSGIKTLKKRISDKLGTTPPELKNFLLHKL